MTFEELGAMLRAEREKRGYTADDVAGRLKISARVIRGLEDGDENALPHAVYLRGFVRSYGTFLGFDEGELNAALDALGEEEPEVPLPPVYSAQEMSGTPSKSRTLPILLLALCLSGGVFFWLYRESDLFSDIRQAHLTTAQPAPSAQAPRQASETPAARAPETPVKPTQPSTATTASTPAPAIPVQPAAPAPIPDSAAATPAPTPQSAPTTSQPPVEVGAQSRQPLPSGQHKIIITALAECWIHSSADSTDTRQFSLRKGDTFALTFANKLVLKLGNAGGVRIRFDGEDMPVAGKEGQVKTLTFPPAE